MLTALKREITRSSEVDQAEKSSLRIKIESLLIDFNEEVFSLTEELARAYQDSDLNYQEELAERAQLFQEKHNSIMKRLQALFSQNPSIAEVKSSAAEELQSWAVYSSKSVERKHQKRSSSRHFSD